MSLRDLARAYLEKALVREVSGPDTLYLSGPDKQAVSSELLSGEAVRTPGRARTSISDNPSEPDRASGLDKPDASDNSDKPDKPDNSVEIPAPYLDAWLRLRVVHPAGTSTAQWQQAIDDAGFFFEQWGSLAADWGWTVADLFDVPRGGNSGGLIWRTYGGTVEAFGPEHARLSDGCVFDLRAERAR